MTHSSQLLVLVEWIPAKAHDHRVNLSLFLVKGARGWAIYLVIGTTWRNLCVAEVYTWGCDVHHLGERIIWQVSCALPVSPTASF